MRYKNDELLKNIVISEDKIILRGGLYPQLSNAPALVLMMLGVVFAMSWGMMCIMMLKFGCLFVIPFPIIIFLAWRCSRVNIELKLVGVYDVWTYVAIDEKTNTPCLYDYLEQKIYPISDDAYKRLSYDNMNFKDEFIRFRANKRGLAEIEDIIEINDFVFLYKFKKCLKKIDNDGYIKIVYSGRNYCILNIGDISYGYAEYLWVIGDDEEQYLLAVSLGNSNDVIDDIIQRDGLNLYDQLLEKVNHERILFIDEEFMKKIKEIIEKQKNQ